jgi:hypothetical protein
MTSITYTNICLWTIYYTNICLWTIYYICFLKIVLNLYKIFIIIKFCFFIFKFGSVYFNRKWKNKSSVIYFKIVFFWLCNVYHICFCFFIFMDRIPNNLVNINSFTSSNGFWTKYLSTQNQLNTQQHHCDLGLEFVFLFTRQTMFFWSFGSLYSPTKKCFV